MFKIQRRAICALLLFAGLAPVHFASASNAVPEGPVRFVAPFVPGGTADVLARTIGQRLGSKYHRTFVVENKPGMGGNLGAAAVAQSKPDGSTLLLGTIGIHSTHSIYPKLQYNPDKDIQPIVILGGVPCVVAVNPSRPFHNLKELIAYAKANPGKLTFGSAGTGSSTHMVGELFQQAAGIKLTHVPYKGSAQAMNDLMGGQIDMMFELLTTATPFVTSGKIRGLAVTSKNRFTLLPNLPTVSEAAVPGFEGLGWFTVATASGVSKEIVAQYNKDINEILREPDLQKTWEGLALQIIGGSAEDARRYVASETVKWKKVIQTANIKSE
ncbi:Bug family tripartite tricarboxylate transporter substrate binding protein [Cupriavidus taiwanensis]|uniref:MFS transporter n=1 Tax=Cupriavidus taiwanensis TaxID=164546 RepID=A0A7Z7NRC9_9BURK|nr:tripartite tricarboxylate transporter substrate binding protein [Cupriavidus taiwanensis]SOZ17197.1 MFS transporter [Cupriavidus taiwanensis]SOZ96478.1 MFS transporter [Cupriavidus taiwanensis]SPC25580.1 MFS transporter [Cupriavidus taiwanensis]